MDPTGLLSLFRTMFPVLPQEGHTCCSRAGQEGLGASLLVLNPTFSPDPLPRMLLSQGLCCLGSQLDASTGPLSTCLPQTECPSLTSSSHVNRVFTDRGSEKGPRTPMPPSSLIMLSRDTWLCPQIPISSPNGEPLGDEEHRPRGPAALFSKSPLFPLCLLLCG